MAQFSGPTSIGTDTDRQFSDVLWRSRFGDEAGVLADFDGTAYALTVTGADTCTIGSSTQDSHATVAGFAHRIPSGSPETVTVPAAVGATRTDRIVLRYDPTWGGALGPVRLTRIEGTSSSAPAYDAGPGGIEELPLYSITRAVGQTLAQATIKKEYPRIGPSMELPTGADLPPSPIGTTIRQGNVLYRRTLNSSSVAVWTTTGVSGAVNSNIGLTSASGWSVTAHGFQNVGNGLAFGSITFTRTGGNIAVDHVGNLANSTVCTLPSAWRPTIPVGGAMYITGRGAWGYLGTDGQVRLTATVPSDTGGNDVITNEQWDLSFGVYPLVDPTAGL